MPKQLSLSEHWGLHKENLKLITTGSDFFFLVIGVEHHGRAFVSAGDTQIIKKRDLTPGSEMAAAFYSSVEFLALYILFCRSLRVKNCSCHKTNNEHRLHLCQEKLHLWHVRKIRLDEILTNLIFFSRNGTNLELVDIYIILYHSNEYSMLLRLSDECSHSDFNTNILPVISLLHHCWIKISPVLKKIIIHWISKEIEQQTISTVICLIINTLIHC